MGPGRPAIKVIAAKNYLKVLAQPGQGQPLNT
jgi:hypothetical protein